MSEPEDTQAAFEDALDQKPDQIYRLRLYVTGASHLSVQAINNIKRICERHLSGRYELDVIDLYQQPELAGKAQLMVAPTLVKVFPPPVRKLIGTLSNSQEVLRRLDLPAA